MRFWSSLLLASALAQAHVVSVSNGELRVSGRMATFELRVPGYEVERSGGAELLDEIRFAGAERTSGGCALEQEWFVCRAEYTFAQDVSDSVEAECTLYRATVPNHIHLLYATNGRNAGEQAFDQTKTHAVLRFRPPSLTGAIARDAPAGFLRLAQSVSALLFLAVAAVSIRKRWEIAALAGLLVVAEFAVRPLAPFVPLSVSPQFLEAMLALTAAYLAGELLWLPESRARWVLVPVFGLAHGLPYSPYGSWFLAGAGVAQLAVLGGFAVLIACAPIHWRRPITALFLFASAAWFTQFLIA